MKKKEEDKIKPFLNEKDIDLTEDLRSESSSHSNVYCKDVFIYSWGKNKYGELGINTAKNTFIPSPVKSLKSSIIKSVKSGGRNTIILTSDGQVLMCGSNIFNLLANNPKFQNNEQYQKTFKNLKFFEENNETIKKIAVAEFHSLALNINGEVYGWGGNLFNKLGQTNGLCGLPSKIYIKRKIVSIACGDYHSCALSENGVLYSWGGGGESYNKGQCGHGTRKDTEYPKKVEFFTKKGLHLLKVACGGYHTIVMDENNQLYGFGKSIYGQCGYGKGEDIDIPQKINFNDDVSQIIDIKCGGEHSVFLSNNGRVYTCGHGYYGQLGLGNNKNVKSPILVHSLSNKNVKEIAAGWSHTLVLTDERIIYAAGCGKFGELGIGEGTNRYNYIWIKKLGSMNVKHIFAGGHHSWCIIDNKVPLKEKFVEPEPLEKPNYKMLKRELSEDSNRNNLSFNDTNNPRNKTSNTVDYGKNRRNPNNNDNSFGNFNNKNDDDFEKTKNNINNLNVIDNKDLKKMIDDYNDDKNKSLNNIDNLIDCFDNLNTPDSIKKKIKYDNINNDNDDEDDKNNKNQNDIDNIKNNNKDDNNYNSGKDSSPFLNDQNNFSDNSFDNKINKIADDNNNNLNDSKNKGNNRKYDNNNDDDYIRNNINTDNINNDDDYLPNNGKNNFNNNKYNNNSKDNFNPNNTNNKKNKNNDFSQQNNKNFDPYNNKYNKYLSNSSGGNNSSRYDNNSNVNNNNYPNRQNKNGKNNYNNDYNNYNNSGKNNYPKNKYNFFDDNNDALLYLKRMNRNKIQLQLIYSELNLSHRFIRFEISSTNKYYKLDFNSINNMMKKYLSLDKGNISFYLQDDREVVKGGKKPINPMMDNLLKEMRDTGLFNSENRNRISYTIAIVYDYTKNDMLRQIYEEIRENYNDKNISFLNFKIIDENQILNENDGIEGALSKWTIEFYEQFKELFIYYDNNNIMDNLGNSNEKIMRPRFLEMRPKIFK